MTLQLKRGARQTLDYIEERLDRADTIARQASNLELEKLLFEIRRELKRELEPMLQRAAPNEPTQDARIRALERKTDDIAGMLSTVMQMLGQTL